MSLGLQNEIDTDLSKTQDLPNVQYSVLYEGVRKRKSHVLFNNLLFNITGVVTRPGGCMRKQLKYNIVLRPGYHTLIEKGSDVTVWYGAKHKRFTMEENMAAKYVRVYYD